MGLIQANWKPTPRQLKQFGVACLVAFPLIGWVWGGSPELLKWLAGAGAVCAVVGFVVPRALLPLFLAISVIAFPIGLVVGEVGLLLVYLGVVLPIGLAFRLVGRDPLERQLDPDASSYWQQRKQATGPASYFKQF